MIVFGRLLKAALQGYVGTILLVSLGARRQDGADYYRQPPDALREDERRHAEIDRLLLEKLERWEELEARSR